MKVRIFLGNRKILIAIFILAVFLLGGIFAAYTFLFSAPQKSVEPELFTTSATISQEDITKRLMDGGFIRNTWAFSFALSRTGKQVERGGYRISKSMDVWQLARVLTSEPTLKWVVIPEGLRKEEVGERLAEAFGWDEKQLHDWNYTYTAMDYDHLEGVYFPDTYLIPVEESGLDVANRLRRRFDEEFAPLHD